MLALTLRAHPLRADSLVVSLCKASDHSSHPPPQSVHHAAAYLLQTTTFTTVFLHIRYYVPQDLFLGAVVPLVTGHTLAITEMDRSSLALCEENPREFPLMDSQRVLGRVVQRARNMRLALRR